MPKYQAELSAITRATMTVVVEAESERDAERALHDIYDLTDGSEFSEDPDFWETGSHYVYGEADPEAQAEYRVLPDGEVEEIPADDPVNKLADIRGHASEALDLLDNGSPGAAWCEKIRKHLEAIKGSAT